MAARLCCAQCYRPFGGQCVVLTARCGHAFHEDCATHLSIGRRELACPECVTVSEEDGSSKGGEASRLWRTYWSTTEASAQATQPVSDPAADGDAECGGDGDSSDGGVAGGSAAGCSAGSGAADADADGDGGTGDGGAGDGGAGEDDGQMLEERDRGLGDRDRGSRPPSPAVPPPPAEWRRVVRLEASASDLRALLETAREEARVRRAELEQLLVREREVRNASAEAARALACCRERSMVSVVLHGACAAYPKLARSGGDAEAESVLRRLGAQHGHALRELHAVHSLLLSRLQDEYSSRLKALSSAREEQAREERRERRREERREDARGEARGEARGGDAKMAARGVGGPKRGGLVAAGGSQERERHAKRHRALAARAAGTSRLGIAGQGPGSVAGVPAAEQSSQPAAEAEPSERHLDERPVEPPPPPPPAAAVRGAKPLGVGGYAKPLGVGGYGRSASASSFLGLNRAKPPALPGARPLQQAARPAASRGERPLCQPPLRFAGGGGEGGALGLAERLTELTRQPLLEVTEGAASAKPPQPAGGTTAAASTSAAGGKAKGQQQALTMRSFFQVGSGASGGGGGANGGGTSAII